MRVTRKTWPITALEPTAAIHFMKYLTVIGIIVFSVLLVGCGKKSVADKAKAAKINELSEPVGSIPKGSERATEVSEQDNGHVKELERENLDLKITNRGKDFLIEQIQKERNGFFDQLLTTNRKVGELEAKLLQLESKNPDPH
jgi:hypothetical protein